MKEKKIPSNRGRPTALTPEVSRAIIRALKAGNHIDVACQIAGVTRATFYNWVKRGKNGEAPYENFTDRIRQTLAHAECDAVAGIRRAGKKYWRALAWFLERRYPTKWGRGPDAAPDNHHYPKFVVSGYTDPPSTEQGDPVLPGANPSSNSDNPNS